MVRFVAIITVLTFVLQASNCYRVSLNDHHIGNSTTSLILNHVDENHNLHYNQERNDTVQDFLTRLSEDVDDEISIASQINAHGLRIKRGLNNPGRTRPHSTSPIRGRSPSRATSPRGVGRPASRQRVNIRRTNSASPGVRPGRRRGCSGSQSRKGSKTRNRSKTRRGSKSSITGITGCQRRGSQVNQAKGHQNNKPSSSNGIQSNQASSSNGIQSNQASSSNGLQSNQASSSNGLQSNQATRPKGSPAEESLRGIVQSFIDNSNNDPDIFDAINPIKKEDKVTPQNPLLSVKDSAKLTQLQSDPSYETMKDLRNDIFAKDKTFSKLNRNTFLAFFKQVTDMPEMKDDDFLNQVSAVTKKPVETLKDQDIIIEPLKNKLKHMFYGETKASAVGRLEGAHDWSAYIGPDAVHEMTGGEVVGVKRIGPGVAVEFKNFKMKFNKGEELSKDKHTIFFGVPPKYQAQLYVKAHFASEAAKNNVNVPIPAGLGNDTSNIKLVIKTTSKRGKANNLSSAYPTLEYA